MKKVNLFFIFLFCLLLHQGYAQESAKPTTKKAFYSPAPHNNNIASATPNPGAEKSSVTKPALPNPGKASATAKPAPEKKAPRTVSMAFKMPDKPIIKPVEQKR